MIGVSFRSSVSICPASCFWLVRSTDAMYCAASLSYWELLKWAAFHGPVPALALVVCSVPNVFLTAPLQTTNATAGTGAWNAAHFKNPQYDKLVTQYIAAADPSTQKSLAGQIETLLLDQTPIVFGYFYNYLTATAQGVTGVYPTAIGHLFLYNAAKG